MEEKIERMDKEIQDLRLLVSFLLSRRSLDSTSHADQMRIIKAIGDLKIETVFGRQG